MIGADAQVTYTVVLTPGEDGWVCAQVAEVPEAISQGRGAEEAKANVTEALELALAWASCGGRDASSSRRCDGGNGHRRRRLTGREAR